jgi:hypothetical protein
VEKHKGPQTTFRFGELEALLADINEIPSVQRTGFQARLKDIQRQGLLRMGDIPKGRAATYGLREVALMAIAVEMCQLGLSTKRAVEVMLADEYPLWMALMMAAASIEERPEVFNPGSADSEPHPDQKIWGFSPEWNDSDETDPLSMFLYFDPSVLAPWVEVGAGEKGEDIASSTFFYAGAGVVGEMVSRWTTGPSRRMALINVTKLLFDIAAYVAGEDGLAICKAFHAEAEGYIHRGDFDLDDWLAHTAKSMGMIVSARGDRGKWVSLKNLIEPDDTLARYVHVVEQVPPEGEPSWVPNRLMPDMIIRLPGQRSLPVDAKLIPLADIPQGGIDSRLQELFEHPYNHPLADRTQYVVLYIPSEQFLADAMAIDHTIIDRALAQKVLIATPAILLNLLAEVGRAWDKYRAEFPDLGEEEFDALAIEEMKKPWPQPDDVGVRTGKRFADMTPAEMALEMTLFEDAHKLEDLYEQRSNQAKGADHGDR